MMKMIFMIAMILTRILTWSLTMVQMVFMFTQLTPMLFFATISKPIYYNQKKHPHKTITNQKRANMSGNRPPVTE